ncbi:unnamed protein product [Linum trigynum]|uniref:Secreted protein n=1 Tax=Linum trigynum TaxID=586398 RepID=A0AAV2FHF5_9ROSI
MHYPSPTRPIAIPSLFLLMRPPLAIARWALATRRRLLVLYTVHHDLECASFVVETFYSCTRLVPYQSRFPLARFYLWFPILYVIIRTGKYVHFSF